MGCLFVMFAGLFPRFGVLFIWLARPAYFSAAFGDTILWPILGIIFLPFTTLMYVLLWSATGLTGWDWLWLVLALFIDVGHWAGNAYANRDRIPRGVWLGHVRAMTRPDATRVRAAVGPSIGYRGG